MDDKKKELEEKLKNKIRAKQLRSGRLKYKVDGNRQLISKEDIMNTTIAMIKDSQLPYIKRLNIREKYNVLSKKYKNLKDQYMPIFRSILNEEITMKNIGMLEMLINMRTTATHEQMNNFLSEKYKLEKDEKSKEDNIDKEIVQKQINDYIKKNKE